jgi:hypothetical protein
MPQKKISIGEAIRNLPVKKYKTAKIQNIMKPRKMVDEAVEDPILGVQDHDDWWLKAHKDKDSDTWRKIQRWD